MKILLPIALLLLPVSAAQGQDAEPGFCARMAAQFDMKAVREPSGKPAYEAKALKGLGVALFGGQTMVGMALGPLEVDEASAPDDADTDDDIAAASNPRRYADACKLTAGRAACDVTGPALFELTVGDHHAGIPAKRGETAVVSMAKNRIRCDGR